jgi:hypothetical protein
MVGDLCNFIMDQIVYHKGTYHHFLSNLGSNPLYQHLRETNRLALGCWWQCGLVVWFGSDFGTVWTLFCMWTCGFLNGLCYNDGLHNGLCCNDGLLWIMTCNDVLNNGLMFVDVYMCICGGQIRIWVIYMWSDLNLNFFAGKSTVGAVLGWTALTNTHIRGGWWYSHPYRSPLQGQLILLAAPIEGTVGAAENTSRPYRGHCRGGQGTAPTKAPFVETPWEGWLAQPPLQ